LSGSSNRLSASWLIGPGSSTTRDTPRVWPLPWASVRECP
jgi:hypothetical protein